MRGGMNGARARRRRRCSVGARRAAATGAPERRRDLRRGGSSSVSGSAGGRSLKSWPGALLERERRRRPAPARAAVALELEHRERRFSSSSRSACVLRPRPRPPRPRCGGAWTGLPLGDRRRPRLAPRPPSCARAFFGFGSSALFRFSRSQRTRTAETWSPSSADRWLRTKMFISLSIASSCSEETPNSAARSCTRVLTTHSSIRAPRARRSSRRRPARGPAPRPP